MNSSYDFWNTVLGEALTSGKGIIMKTDAQGFPIPRPEESGLFRRSVGERKGQIADWRASVNGSERGIHVVEFPDHYTIHVDRYDPGKRPVMHLVRDSPKTLVSIFASGLFSLLFFSLFRRR